MDLSAVENLNEQPRIRPVDSSHIADLMRIADETNLSPWTAQSYLEEMKNADAIMLRLISDDNRINGFVVGRIVQSGTIEAGPEAEIYNIAVTQSEQGKGLGQLLLDAFTAASTDRNAARIWLEVRESNAQAISFYQKNGFEKVQTRNHFYDNPREHAILMKRELKKAQG
jgi:ribosomal-protein-alanine N-acetyltransferase